MAKIDDNNLSLLRLIKELNRDKANNVCVQNEHFDWFVDFVLTKNSSFDKLLKYRHPLIHYKIEAKTGKGIGSLIATVLNTWSDNLFDKEKLKSIEKENEKIKLFLIEQFDKCKLGYEHMIELIKKLPDKK